MSSPHAARLERWLGAEPLAAIQAQMKDWYGPPILMPVGAGDVLYAHKGGEFSGRMARGRGSFAGAADYFADKARARFKRWAIEEAGKANAGGFTSLGGLISAATTGGRRDFSFQKVGTTGVVGICSSLWRVGNLPSAAGASSAAPGGDALTDASTGGIPFDNPTGGATQHLASAFPISTSTGAVLLYDRLFQVGKTMSSNTTEAVTGVPTRYTSTTAGAVDSAEGNFMFPEVQAALGATAHNWTVCKYTNQAGTTGQSAPSMAGVASAIINRFDSSLASWFMPLAAGDTGVKALTQMQCSASVTGTLSFVVGHPLALMPIPVANVPCIFDGINSAFNLVRIFDDACLAFIELTRTVTTAATLTGSLVTVRA